MSNDAVHLYLSNHARLVRQVEKEVIYIYLFYILPNEGRLLTDAFVMEIIRAALRRRAILLKAQPLTITNQPQQHHKLLLRR